MNGDEICDACGHVSDEHRELCRECEVDDCDCCCFEEKEDEDVCSCGHERHKHCDVTHDCEVGS